MQKLTISAKKVNPRCLTGSVVPRAFLGLLVHKSTMYLSGTQGPPLWFCMLSETFLQFRVFSLT